MFALVPAGSGASGARYRYLFWDGRGGPASTAGTCQRSQIQKVSRGTSECRATAGIRRRPHRASRPPGLDPPSDSESPEQRLRGDGACNPRELRPTRPSCGRPGRWGVVNHGLLCLATRGAYSSPPPKGAIAAALLTTTVKGSASQATPQGHRSAHGTGGKVGFELATNGIQLYDVPRMTPRHPPPMRTDMFAALAVPARTNMGRARPPGL